jgi:hypothetical protein
MNLSGLTSMSLAAARKFAMTVRFCLTAAILAAFSASFQGCGREQERCGAPESRATGPEDAVRRFAEAVLGARFDVAAGYVRGNRMSKMLDDVRRGYDGIQGRTAFRPAGVKTEGDQAVVQLEFIEGKVVWYGVYFLKDFGRDGWKITDLSGGKAPMVLKSVEGCRDEALRRIRKAIRKSVEKSASDLSDDQS